MVTKNTTPCHCSALRRAARGLTALYDRSLAPVGLTLPQFSLLRRLQRAGPLSVTRLADVAQLERTTLGRNLRPLENAGLVQARPSDTDGRERIVALTAEGTRVIARALPCWIRAQENLERRLGAGPLAALHDLLNELGTIED